MAATPARFRRGLRNGRRRESAADIVRVYVSCRGRDRILYEDRIRHQIFHCPRAPPYSADLRRRIKPTTPEDPALRPSPEMESRCELVWDHRYRSPILEARGKWPVLRQTPPGFERR